ncbi:Crp/Fnr family transcriptional regulator [Paenibacillus pasadenensis]|uniref:Crp/Fnr family transcriptional regulator n=1 Tax=Paenibacillus TaxID=44249 RepID=UPI00048ABEBF|nr:MULTISPECIES: Crp/Fnr family transcriptional regulator [Paenibacillus]QGG56356.1 cyclic nucleotide-binding domain-containing protein [Paenibacillus sp. B01]
MKVSYELNEILEFIARFELDTMFSELNSIPLQLRSYRQNEVVLHEGDELEGLYLLLEGQAKVTTSVENGKSLLLRFCHPVSVFGDIELIQKVDIQSQVLAVEDSRFLFIDKATVENKLLQDYRFLNELLKHLTYKLQTCTSASRINLLSSVEERLAIYLLTTRDPNEFGKEIQTENIAEISSVIGTTTRHLNRTIQKLSDSGVLIKKRNGFLVNDWDKLDEITGGLRYH